MFKNKTLLISGGTGSFGKSVLKRFLKSGLAEIRIFSRDEKKQDDLRKFYNNPKLKFYTYIHACMHACMHACRRAGYLACRGA